MACFCRCASSATCLSGFYYHLLGPPASDRGAEWGPSRTPGERPRSVHSSRYRRTLGTRD